MEQTLVIKKFDRLTPREVYEILKIRTAEIFKSPTYYLQQNDIVYVEPKYKERNEKAWQTTSFVLSLVGVMSTILWALSATGVF